VRKDKGDRVIFTINNEVTHQASPLVHFVL